MKKIIITLFTSTMWTLSANAAVIANDSFDYSTGFLDGQTGGAGWSAAWTPFSGEAETYTTTAGSGSTVTLVGASNSDIERQFTSTTSGDFWFSYTFQSTTDATNEFRINGTTNGGANRFRIVKRGNDQKLKFEGSFGSVAFVDGGASEVLLAGNTTYSVLGHARFNNGSSKSDVEAWLYAGSDFSGAELATASGEASGILSDFEYLNLRSSKVFQFDQISLGTDMASVIPEPSSLLLMGVALGGIMMMRRRK